MVPALSLTAALVLGGSRDARAAGADDLPQRPKFDELDLWMASRLRATALRDFPLDDVGTRSGQHRYYESRIRAGALAHFGEIYSVKLELDLLSGIFAGDRTALGTAAGDDTLRDRHDRTFGAGVLRLRELYLAVRLPFGELRVGQQAFTFGLGVRYLGGEGEPDFGDRRLGTIVERLFFSTRPFASSLAAKELVSNATLFVALDAVLRDQMTDFASGDRAYGATIGVRSSKKDFAFGVLEAFRLEKDRDDGGVRAQTRSLTTDAYATAVVAKLGDVSALRVEAESVVVAGDSERALSFGPAGAQKLRQFGGVMRLRFDDDELMLTVKNDLGLATSFSSAGDLTPRSFSFNADYRVGLILFDQVLGRLSARAADRVIESSSGAPPSNARWLPTQGAVTNALYLAPVVRWNLARTIDLRLGYLLAFRAGDLRDPYSSSGALAGGRALGHELDYSARVRLHLDGSLYVRVGFEGGIFFAGSALNGVAGNALGTVWMARGLADLTW